MCSSVLYFLFNQYNAIINPMFFNYLISTTMINSPDYQNTRFSIFPSGWWDEKNQKAVPSQSPQQKQTIKWVYDYIIGGPACQATIRLRNLFQQSFRRLRTFQKLTKHNEYWLIEFTGIRQNVWIEIAVSHRNPVLCILLVVSK